MRYLPYGLLSMFACTTYTRAPETCGLGETTSEQAFAESFLSMALVLNDGSELPAGPDRPQLTPEDVLLLRLETLDPVQIRVCVEQTRTGGALVLDTDVAIPAGKSEALVGDFDVGGYAIRVAFEDTLIRSYFFEVQE